MPINPSLKPRYDQQAKMWFVEDSTGKILAKAQNVCQLCFSYRRCDFNEEQGSCSVLS